MSDHPPITTRPTLLEVNHLCGWYGAAQILFDVSLSVGQGEVVALLGRNGAGKSTTLKTIMGLMEKRQGQIGFMGKDISKANSHEVARLGLGYVPEDRRIFTDLTVMENLEVGRQATRIWPVYNRPARECRRFLYLNNRPCLVHLIQTAFQPHQRLLCWHLNFVDWLQIFCRQI